jgi:iron-sulfur cluster repair protein YtfE (RIC family)
MADVDNLKRQHEEIAELIEKLASYKDNEKIKREAFPLSLTLGHLAGKISVHLSIEDKLVYPKLLAHENEIVREKSKQFSEEMGNIAAVFTQYKNKYNSATRISTEPAAFKQETEKIKDVLLRRVDAENNILYPLVS